MHEKEKLLLSNVTSSLLFSTESLSLSRINNKNSTGNLWLFLSFPLFLELKHWALVSNNSEVISFIVHMKRVERGSSKSAHLAHKGGGGVNTSRCVRKAFIVACTLLHIHMQGAFAMLCCQGHSDLGVGGVTLPNKGIFCAPYSSKNTVHPFPYKDTVYKNIKAQNH